MLCGRCNKPKGESDDCCRCGRPVIYGERILKLADEYFTICQDREVEKGNPEKPIYGLKVKLPTKGGLAKFLGVSRETLYAWAKEYPEFSDVMESLGSEQEDRLINSGLSGEYNPTIAKVLLTKHGYREGIDQTTNDKDLPVPILGGVSHENEGTSKKIQ